MAVYNVILYYIPSIVEARGMHCNVLSDSKNFAITKVTLKVYYSES